MEAANFFHDTTKRFSGRAPKNKKPGVPRFPVTQSECAAFEFTYFEFSGRGNFDSSEAMTEEFVKMLLLAPLSAPRLSRKLSPCSKQLHAPTIALPAKPEDLPSNLQNLKSFSKRLQRKQKRYIPVNRSWDCKETRTLNNLE